MSTHHDPAGFLHRFQGVFLAFALIMASTVAVDQEPASAACVRHNHVTWPNDGWLDYSWAREVPPHEESTCNDVNVTWASHSGPVLGQYHHSQLGWLTGVAGIEWVWAGNQRSWRVLITNLRNGSLYRVGTRAEWREFVIAV